MDTSGNPSPPRRLDSFADSDDAMLRNDLVQALVRRDGTTAGQAAAAPASRLALAEPGQASAAERAMRLPVGRPGLERQCRHPDRVARRKALRSLSATLCAAARATCR